MSLMTAGVTRPPILRSTTASPIPTPRVWAGSTRGSMHVTMYRLRNGRNGSAGTLRRAAGGGHARVGGAAQAAGGRDVLDGEVGDLEQVTGLPDPCGGEPVQRRHAGVGDEAARGGSGGPARV